MVQSLALTGHHVWGALRPDPVNNAGIEVKLPVVGALPPNQIPDTNNWLPWLAVLGAWVCFGSFAVPMKSQAVMEAGVHPLIFQCYKTFWAFSSSFLVLFFQPFEFTWWGVVSGFSWVPAGIAAVIAVQNIGIACGQSLWQVTIIGSSFLWSILVLRDCQVHSWVMTALALACLLVGVVGMAVAFNMKVVALPEGGEEEDESSNTLNMQSEVVSRMPHARSEPALMLRSGTKSTHDLASFAIPDLTVGGVRRAKSEAGLIDPQKTETTELSSSNEEGEELLQFSYPIGVAAAVFNGVWGGANLVPSHFSTIQGVHYVISFGIGALIANAIVLLLFFLYKASRSEDMPPCHARVMMLPGFLSGMLWSGGNFCSLYLVSTLGQGIGNSLVQASVIVSGLWGILYYREMVGQPILYWAVACAICGAGVVGLALEGVS
mmetsp:Transcript_3281/g.7885  ORF Transcript_3281/g.7885 Transcript_3281/m.7885 type:complete len:434 (+) Transcript_3281:207-1508(+)